MVLNIFILTHSFRIVICVMNDKKKTTKIEWFKHFHLFESILRFLCLNAFILQGIFFWTKRGNISNVQNIQVNSAKVSSHQRNMEKSKPKKCKSNERSRSWLHSVEHLLQPAQRWVGKFKECQKMQKKVCSNLLGLLRSSVFN